jgi:hypothetical protein
MYEVFLKSWYQELPNDGIQEEIMFESDNIDDAWNHLKLHADHYMEFYPLVEMGVRLKN